MMRADRAGGAIDPLGVATAPAASRFAAHVRQSLWRRLGVIGALVLSVVFSAAIPEGSSWLAALGVGLLAAGAVLLISVAWQQQRVQRQFLELATWPGTPEDDDPTFLRQSLQHVRRLQQARSVVLIQEQPDHVGRIDLCDDAGGRSGLEPVSEPESHIAGALTGAAFFCNLWGAQVCDVVFRSPVGIQRWRGTPVQGQLVGWMKGTRLLSAPLNLQGTRGRLFAMDGRRGSVKGLFFAEAVAEALATRLEGRRLAGIARQRAVIDERGRFSRDLHDGLLQSMTAWTLQIGDIALRLESGDAVASARLHHLRRQIAADQRELRTFIGRLHAEGIEPLDFSLIGRLHDLRDRFSEEWGLTVEVDFSGLHALVPTALRAEVCRLVHEGLANAARHSQTSLVRVELAASDAGVFVSVRDRGRGFPFHGRFDLARLRQDGQGPSSLIERVSALGGELVIESSAAGASVEILLPLDQARGRATEHAS